ncbi:hypothetical protein Tco_0826839 [Tanacetum coccineum]
MISFPILQTTKESKIVVVHVFMIGFGSQRKKEERGEDGGERKRVRVWRVSDRRLRKKRRARGSDELEMRTEREEEIREGED